jgi:hypothetical protein
MLLKLEHRVLTSLAPNAPRGLIESIALLAIHLCLQSIISDTIVLNPISRDHLSLILILSIAAALAVPLGKPVQDAWTPSRDREHEHENGRNGD